MTILSYKSLTQDVVQISRFLRRSALRSKIVFTLRFRFIMKNKSPLQISYVCSQHPRLQPAPTLAASTHACGQHPRVQPAPMLAASIHTSSQHPRVQPAPTLAARTHACSRHPRLQPASTRANAIARANTDPYRRDAVHFFYPLTLCTRTSTPSAPDSQHFRVLFSFHNPSTTTSLLSRHSPSPRSALFRSSDTFALSVSSPHVRTEHVEL